MSSPRRAALSLAERAVARVASRRPTLEARSNRRRARLLAARIRLRAAWVGADVDVEIGEHVQLGRRITVVVEPGTRSTLHIGDHCDIDDDVRLQLKGGRLALGTGTQLRRGVVLNVAGELRVGEQAMISWYSVVHCANHVELGRHVFTGDSVTIVDSTHHFTAPDDWALKNVEVGAVRVGENTWISSKATVQAGVTIGSHCIVGAGAVVTTDVPAGHLAVGAPARSRPLDLPWALGAPTTVAGQPPTSAS